jgi:transcriptional regulator with XRE-family HTH domain
MPKLINLAGKIKDTRKRLGMTQKQFILEVSKKLYLTTSLNESLASQWESNLKNRAKPNDEQLAAIAELTSRPWETIWWFMRDDIDHKRGYELYPNGQYTIAPPDLSAEEEEEILAAMAAKHKAAYSEPITPKLTAWKTEPSTMWSLYHPPEPKPIAPVDRALGIAGLLPGTPCKHCGFKNQQIAIACGNCGAAIDATGIRGGLFLGKGFGSSGGLLSSGLTSSGGIPPPDTLKKTTDGLNKYQNTIGNQKGLVVPRGPGVSDYVEFPELPPLRPQSSEHDFLEDAEIENNNNFWSAVKFFASNDHYLSIEHFNQRIQTGAISQYVNYFDGDRAIQVTLIRRHTELRVLRRVLQTRMMELCFIDRMKKRTSKKLILVSTYEKGLKLYRLEEHLDELIHSSELLGVQIQFASGPLEVAEKIADFRTQKASEE